jgi:carbon monoxide dehydrogenase subunit G
MWAYIKDNKIEQIYQRPKSLVIGEVRYPSNMFTKYTDAEKAAIGIYSVEDTGTKGNDRFEYTSQATYTWSASDKKVTTSYTITDKSLVDVNDVDSDGNAVTDYKGNQTVTLGLKSIAKEKVKQQANSFIKQFNWLVERSIYDSSKAIPDVVKTYVAAIKTDCANIETAIDNASDMAAFKKLYDWEYNEDGSVKTIAPIQNWSDDYDVKKYVR